MRKIYSKSVSIKDVSNSQKLELYSIYKEYYSHANKKRFLDEINQADLVMLVFCGETDVIVGFSTLRHMVLDINSQKVFGTFPGDTVIKKEYWGGQSLGIELGIQVLKQKIKHFPKKYYLFLISKGYKTYLLLANNFTCYFPRQNVNTPLHHQHIMDSYADKLYGDLYHKEKGVIEFEGVHDSVKRGVADIDSQMLQNPKIAYFVKMNPDYRKGTELVCLGECRFTDLFKYCLKFLKNLLKIPK